MPLGDRRSPRRRPRPTSTTRELVAAEADARRRGSSQRCVEPRPDLPQQLVAGGVAEGVVDLLEVVEVDEQERQRLRSRGRVGLVGEEGVEHLEQLAAVAEPGELVGDRLAVALAR